MFAPSNTWVLVQHRSSSWTAKETLSSIQVTRIWSLQRRERGIIGRNQAELSYTCSVLCLMQKRVECVSVDSCCAAKQSKSGLERFKYKKQKLMQKPLSGLRIGQLSKTGITTWDPSRFTRLLATFYRRISWERRPFPTATWKYGRQSVNLQVWLLTSTRSDSAHTHSTAFPGYTNECVHSEFML